MRSVGLTQRTADRCAARVRHRPAVGTGAPLPADEFDRIRQEVRAFAARPYPRGLSMAVATGVDVESVLDVAVTAGRTAGVLAVSARCAPVEADLPFGVVSQLAADLRGAGHRLLMRPLWMDQQRAAAIPALCAEIMALADRHPLLIAVGDVRWADPDSRRWLDAMSERARQAPLLLIQATGATRDRAAAAIDYLPPEALALLRAMAVCGDAADLDVVAFVAAPHGIVLPILLELLVRLDLVTDDDRPRLVSEAVSDRVLAGMTPSERADLAVRAAELGHRAALSSTCLAELLMSGPPIRSDWAVSALRRAAARHFADGDARVATALLSRVVRADADAEHPLALIDLALAEVEDDHARANRRLQQVLLGAGPDTPLCVLLRAADLLQCGGDAATAHWSIALAHDRAEPGTADASALAAIGWLAADDSAADPVLPVAALPELPTVPTDPVVAAVVAWRLSAQGMLRTTARDLARHALRGAGSEAPLGSRIHACRALACADEPDEALQGLDAVLLDARRGNARMPAVLALLERAKVELAQGNTSGAAEAVERACAEVPFESWHPRHRPWRIALEAGRYLAEQQVDQAERELSRELPSAAADGAGWAFLQFAQGSLRMALADPRAALPHFKNCGRALAARRWTNPAVSHWRSMAAVAHAACGEAGAAATLANDALVRAQRWEGLIAMRQVLALGVVVDADFEAHHAKPGSLLSASRLAGGGVRPGSTNAATSTPLRPAVDKVRGLTAPEERVAALAVAGMPNAGIARHLALSTRTVEARLTSIYRKLSLNGRRDLEDLLG